jgi:hypothetical protein
MVTGFRVHPLIPRKKLFLTQRREGAKTLGNAAALCAFASLREKSSSWLLFLQAA